MPATTCWSSRFELSNLLEVSVSSSRCRRLLYCWKGLGSSFARSLRASDEILILTMTGMMSFALVQGRWLWISSASNFPVPKLWVPIYLVHKARTSHSFQERVPRFEFLRAGVPSKAAISDIVVFRCRSGAARRFCPSGAPLKISCIRYSCFC